MVAGRDAGRSGARHRGGQRRPAIQAVANTSAPFDIVLLDLRLPDSTDLRLLTQLRCLAPDGQVIVMTAFGTPELTQRALDLLVKTGGRLVKHARYYWLLLAEGHLTRHPFGWMLRRIRALPVPTG